MNAQGRRIISSKLSCLKYVLFKGRTTNTLTVYNVQPEDSGYYRCSVSNNSGTTYSNYATLNITGTLYTGCL